VQVAGETRSRGPAHLVYCFLGPLVRREVACHFGEADEGILLVQNGPDEAAGPEARSVLAYVPALVLGPALGSGLLEFPLVGPTLTVLGREEDGSILA
jgi:hypothetical protein